MRPLFLTLLLCVTGCDIHIHVAEQPSREERLAQLREDLAELWTIEPIDDGIFKFSEEPPK